MVKDLVANRDGVPVTTSLKIAEYFDKEHFHVTRDIEQIIKDLKEVDKSPSDQDTTKIGGIQKFFIKSTYTDDGGRKRKMYYVTEDGFNLLAMGFTGKKALKYKLAFLAEFRRMRDLLNSPDLDYRTRQELAYKSYLPSYHYHMDAVKALIDYTVSLGLATKPEMKHYTYPRVNGTVNRALHIPKGERKNVNPVTAEHLKMINRSAQALLTKSIAACRNPFNILDDLLEHIRAYGRKVDAANCLDASDITELDTGADRTLDQPKVYTFDNHYIH